jgi:hypothetical protein
VKAPKRHVCTLCPTVREFGSRTARRNHQRDVHSDGKVVPVQRPPSDEELVYLDMRKALKAPAPRQMTTAEATPDWGTGCMNCGQSPVLPVTQMCGPCTFGEADTLHGNW